MKKYKKLHTVYNNTGKRKLKSLFSIIGVGLSWFAHAQTTPTASENYIYTKIYLSADGSKKNETVQYFDGLGRAKQIVQVKVTPSGQDLATPVVYDDLGRQVKSILPVPVPTANLGIQNTVSETSANTYYGVSNAYTEQKLEASPLARTLETAHPGTEWAMNTGHTVKTQYLTNTTSDQVKRFATDAAWNSRMLTTSITGISTYGNNQLSKTIVSDENGNTTTEFKNSEGKTILVRKESGTTKQDTYYIYNDLNMLAFVISPKAVESIAANSNSLSQQVLNDLCYQYIYDNKYRLIEKKLPGKGWEYMVYDQQNRLVATQDANMKNNPDTPNQWLFTRYDKFGRIVYTGRFTGGTRAQEQANADLKGLNNEARSTTSFIQNTQEVFYSNAAYPAGTFTLYSVNYYDTYPGTNFNNTLPRPETILGQTILSGSSTVTANGITSIRSTMSMPTASLVKNLDDDNWSSTHIWYDLTGRPVGSQGKNHLGGYTKTEKQLDFSGAVLMANTYHKKLSTDTEISIKERFVYDNQFRLKQHYHQVNSLTEELLADYTYNELGQLTSKKVGNNLQDIQYTYNTRGWVSKINDPANLGSKLFGYELKFGSTSNASVAQANYNGNITEVNWKTAADGILKRYSYQYDGYNRLTGAVYQEPESTVPQNGFYNENMSYDSNGNIMALNRNQKSYSGFAEQIDELMYTYNGNRLTSVVDQKSNYSGYPDTSGNTITYDDNGNMTKHLDKGILQIKYNYLNLPYYIKFNDYVTRNGEDIYSNVQYAYRADGVKIKKKFHYFSGKTKQDTFVDTEYIDGFQYSYQLSDLFNNGLKFFATSEGYYDYVKKKYIYNYIDHLGNVRVSFTREGAQAAIVEKNDYYAFGLKHGNPTDTSGVNYNYEYNGKEFQQEIGMNDYGARFYMPDIGRWGVVDPLAEVYRRHSPYNYAVNNPIVFVDPDGRGVEYNWGTGDYESIDSNGTRTTLDEWDAMNYLLSQSHSVKVYRTNAIAAVNQDSGGTGGGGSSTFEIGIYGQFAQAAFDLLKESMKGQLNLTYKNGIVSGSAIEGVILSEAAQMLLEAIRNPDIKVNLETVFGFRYYDAILKTDVFALGDAFKGSFIYNGKVTATNYVSPKITEEFDKILGSEKGVSLLHAALEAYIGALHFPGKDRNTAYDYAHPEAACVDPRYKDLPSNYIQGGSVQRNIQGRVISETVFFRDINTNKIVIDFGTIKY
jgi:RHS repeat-associated protein